MTLISVDQKLLSSDGFRPLRHVAGVPNGNRRKAVELGIPLSESYRMGASRALDFVSWTREIKGATEVTLFGLAIQNRGREEEQLDALVEGALWFCKNIDEVDCRVHPFGKLHELKGHKNYAELMERLDEMNAKNQGADFTVHIAVNYSGTLDYELDPLFDAVNESIVREQDESKRIAFFEQLKKHRREYLLSAGVSDIDLFIRSGGENRLSGLLPFQTCYAELYFSDLLWADFTKEYFDKAVRWYDDQQRNFGK